RWTARDDADDHGLHLPELLRARQLGRLRGSRVDPAVLHHPRANDAAVPHPRPQGALPVSRVLGALIYAALVVCAFLVLFPLIWMFLGSFKSVQEINLF